jgi:hypothetical protein
MTICTEILDAVLDSGEVCRVVPEASVRLDRPASLYLTIYTIYSRTRSLRPT